MQLNDRSHAQTCIWMHLGVVPLREQTPTILQPEFEIPTHNNTVKSSNPQQVIEFKVVFGSSMATLEKAAVIAAYILLEAMLYYDQENLKNN